MTSSNCRRLLTAFMIAAFAVILLGVSAATANPVVVGPPPPRMWLYLVVFFALTICVEFETISRLLLPKINTLNDSTLFKMVVCSNIISFPIFQFFFYQSFYEDPSLDSSFFKFVLYVLPIELIPLVIEFVLFGLALLIKGPRYTVELPTRTATKAFSAKHALLWSGIANAVSFGLGLVVTAFSLLTGLTY